MKVQAYLKNHSKNEFYIKPLKKKKKKKDITPLWTVTIKVWRLWKYQKKPL